MLTLTRNGNAWQHILADLALILFLVCAAALSASTGLEDAPAPTLAPDNARLADSFAPAQALYRAGPDLPSLAQWLEEQPRDPRAALTIVAQHTPGEEEIAWSKARELAAAANALGVRSRVIIREGTANAIHASLGYDQPLS